MASNVTIAYLADVTDLKTKAALAKAALADVSAETKRQAAAFADLASEAKGPALAALQGLTAQQAQLQAAIAAATRSAKTHIEAESALGGILGRNRAAFMEAEHVARSFADGIASGADPMRLLAQESGRIIQTLTELNGVNLASLAGWGAVAAGVVGAAGALVYFGEQAEKASRDAHEMQSVFKAGNFDASQDTIMQWSYDLQGFGDLSEAEAKKVVTALGNMRGRTVESVQAMIDVLPLFAKRLGTDIPTAANELIRVLGNVSKEGAKFLEQINASVDVQNNFQKALARTDGSSFSVVLSELTRQALAFGDAEKYAIAQASSLVTPASKSASNRAGGTGGEAYNLQLEAQRAQKAVEDVASALAKADTMQGTVGLDAFRLKAKEVADDLSKTTSQKAAATLAIWNEAVASGRFAGEQLTQAEQAQTDARIAAARSESSEVIRLAELSASRRAAASGPDRAGQVRAEIAAYQETLQSAKLTADDKEELENRVAALQVQLVRRASSEAKKSAAEQWQAYRAGIEEQIAADKGHLDQQIAIAREYVDRAKKAWGENSANFEQAKKQEVEIERQISEQKLAVAKEMAEAQANLSKIGERPDLGEFKPSIGLAFDSSGLDAKVAAQIAQLHDVMDQQIAALAADMKGKLQLGDVVGAAGDYKEITADMAAMAAKVQEINQQTTQAIQQSWEKIGAPIENAFSRIAGAAIGGGRNSAHAMEAAAASVVEGWAKSALESVVHWAAAEMGMTAASAAGSAARTAAATPEEAQMLARLAAQLGMHVTVEAAKTGATVTGVAVRTGAEVSGAAASKSAQAAINGPSILGSAAKAAAGAYSAVAGIPYVGPILAPAAAAVAFSAVAAYQTVASAEGGWGNVPFDDAPALLHRNEMVLPASIASSVREMAARGGISGNAPSLASAASGAPSSVTNIGGASSHAFHYSPTIHAQGADANAIHSVLRDDKADWHKQALAYYGRTGTPTLPGRKVRQ